MANERVREEAKSKKVPLWEVARFLGISEATMTRMLRTPLSHEKETAVFEAIRKLSAHRLEVT